MDAHWQDKLAALKAAMPGGDMEPGEDTVPEQEPKAEQKGRLDIILDRKGRAGKVATIIAGFTIGDGEVADLAGEIKRALGTGGSARGGEILIQGNRRDDVLAFLSRRGIKARKI